MIARDTQNNSQTVEFKKSQNRNIKMEALAAEIQHRMENEVAEIKKIENGKLTKCKSKSCFVLYWTFSL